VTTAASYAALLEQLATSAHSDRVAILDDTAAVSFARLRDDVASIAAGLAELGVGEGDVVAIWMPNTIEWAEATLAIGVLGAVTLGINSKLRSYDVEQLLRESQAKVLIAWPGFKGIDFLGMIADIVPSLPDSLTHVVAVHAGARAEALAVGGRELCTWESLLLAQPLDLGDRDPELFADDAANAFTSSGSTGKPKIVLQTQRAVLLHSFAVAERFGYTERGDEVVFGILPLCGVFGFNTLFAGLAAGRPTVLQAAFKAGEAIELIERHRITHMNVSDTMLVMMLDVIDAEGPGGVARVESWREAAFGAFTAIDPVEIVARGTALGKKFFQTYGASEVMAIMTYPAAASGPARWAVGGGVPVSPEYEARVRDTATGSPLPGGMQGELELRGPNLAIGLLTEHGIVPTDRTDDGYLPTGDLAMVEDDGDVVYLGRLGDAVRLSGFLVSPREVEAFLAEVDGVAEAQFVAVASRGALTPVAFVIPEPGHVLSERDVLDACAGRLAAFKTPRHVVVVDSFPLIRGANGDKVERGRLRQIALELVEGANA
jgi:fatty-acyl-CoA synthase